MSRVVEELGGKLVEEVLVAVLEGGEVQSREGFLVCGVARAQDKSDRSLLHSLELSALGGVDGRRPGWGRVRELREYEGTIHTR